MNCSFKNFQNTDKHIKYFLFDLDGTLFNSINGIAYCCNKALEKYELKTYKTDKYLDFIGNGVKLLLERAIGKDILNDEIYNNVKKEFDRLYKVNYNKDCQAYDGIMEMLKLLKDKNAVVGILSNKPDNFVKEINKTIFNSTLDIAIGQRKGYKVKPDNTAICEIIKGFNADKNQCVYIGDSYVDVLTAKNAGILSVAVTYGFGKVEETLEYIPDYVCESVSELSDLLISLA